MNMMESEHEICTLLHACLLEKEEENCVKMHDVIRDMALWIASTVDEKENSFVLAGVGLEKAPGIGLWKEITRMTPMQKKLGDF